MDGLIFGLIAFTTMIRPLQKRLGDKRAQTVVVSKHEAGLTSTQDWPRFFIALVLFHSFRTVITFINLADMITFLELNGAGQGL